MRDEGFHLAAVAASIYLCLHASSQSGVVSGSQLKSRAMREHEPHRHSGFHMGRSVTVVVNINQHVEANLAVVHALHNAYSGVFHRVVFTGQSRPKGLNSLVRWTPCEESWHYFGMCLAYAMAEYPESPEGGYLFIGDDTIVDPCHLALLDGRKFWTPRLWLVPYEPGVREDPGWAWWFWGDERDQWNTSYGLDVAFAKMPDFYKEALFKRLGPDVMDADGKMKQMVHHTEVDFFYVPATAAADWIHLGNHFHFYKVMSEVSIPHLLYFLAGPHGMEEPRYYNVVGMKTEVDLPEDLIHNSWGLSDEDAQLLLRNGEGMYLPEGWLRDPDIGDWKGTPLTWYHAYKLGSAVRREGFMQWWWSLPCLKGMHI